VFYSTLVLFWSAASQLAVCSWQRFPGERYSFAEELSGRLFFICGSCGIFNDDVLHECVRFFIFYSELEEN